MKATYVKTKLNNIITINKIVTIHYFEFDSGFVFEGERHNFWEMVYVDKGQIAVRRDDEELLLSHGEALFHAPDEFHSLRAYRSSPNVFIISFVCESDSMQYFRRLHTVVSPRLHPYIAAIIREAERTYVMTRKDVHMKKLTRRDTAEIGGEQLVKTYLEQLLIFMIRGIVNNREVFPSREQMETHLVTLVKQYVGQHIGERISVDNVCCETGYSRTYLCRVFRQQSGDTIAHYVTVRKIEAAKELIRGGGHNLSEISDMLAFDNPQYFSQVFKRITGMTPSEYRQSLLAYD